MRIAEFRRAVVGAPWRQLIFAELVTDDGLTGVGEVRMVNKTRTLLACVEELAPRYVLGTDPFGAASSELPAAEGRRSVAIVAAVRDAVRRATRIPIAMGERPPAGPGLGVRLDREACLPHPPTGARLELFREGWETRHQEGG